MGNRVMMAGLAKKYKEPIRYIRDYQGGGDNNWRVEIMAYVNEVNQALYKAVTHNGTAVTSNPITVLTDGYLNHNVWSTVSGAGSVSYVQVDLAAEYEVNRIEIYRYIDGRSYTDCRLEVSSDGLTWREVWNGGASVTTNTIVNI